MQKLTYLCLIQITKSNDVNVNDLLSLFFNKRWLIKGLFWATNSRDHALRLYSCPEIRLCQSSWEMINEDMHGNESINSILQTSDTETLSPFHHRRFLPIPNLMKSCLMFDLCYNFCLNLFFFAEACRNFKSFKTLA